MDSENGSGKFDATTARAAQARGVESRKRRTAQRQKLALLAGGDVVDRASERLDRIGDLSRERIGRMAAGALVDLTMKYLAEEIPVATAGDAARLGSFFVSVWQESGGVGESLVGTLDRQALVDHIKEIQQRARATVAAKKAAAETMAAAMVEPAPLSQ